MGPFDLLALPSEHDIAYGWTKWILPGVEVSGPWQNALAVFSGSLAFLGSLFITWHILSGIVSTAYTGKVLGGRWHQIWAPLRVVLGFGMLMPINGGFSSAHHGIQNFVVLPGIVMANATWSVFVDSVADKKMPIKAHVVGGSTLVMDIFEHEICAAVADATGHDWGIKGQFADGGGEIKYGGWIGEGAAQSIEWDYGADCGRISFPINSAHESFGTARQFAISNIIAKVRAHGRKYGEFFAKHDTVLSVGSVWKAAAEFGSLPLGVATDIRKWGLEYNEALTEAAQTEVDKLVDPEARKKMVGAAKQQGFANAGSYFRALGQISESVNALTSEKYGRVAVRTEEGFSGSLNIAAAIKTFRYHVAAEEQKIGLSANDLASAGDESSDFLTKILAPVRRSIGEWFASPSASSAGNTNAIARLISDGHVLMSIAEVAITGSAVAITLAYTAPGKVIGADGLASWFLDWGKIPIAIMWILGAIRAYVIPFLPFFYVFSNSARWLVVVLEAVIAAIVWSFAFIRMDGEELIDQQQRTGGLLMFNVFLRPTLIVLGLIASYLVLDPVLSSLDELWAVAFYGQTGGHVIGLGAMITSLALKTLLTWVIVTQILSLVNDLADRIGDWFGIPGAGKLGESRMGDAATVAAVAMLNQGKNIPITSKGLPQPNDPAGSGGGHDVGGVTSKGN